MIPRIRTLGRCCSYLINTADSAHLKFKKMEQPKPLETPTTQVQGEEMYSDHGKMYIISIAKMADIASMKPGGGTELLEFFIKHADLVIDEEKNIPVCVLRVVVTGERKYDNDLDKKEG